jgi:hypothetical protein
MAVSISVMVDMVRSLARFSPLASRVFVPAFQAVHFKVTGEDRWGQAGVAPN